MTTNKAPELTNETKQPAADTAGEMTLEYISLDLIDDPPNPMRSDMTPESLQELVISIKRAGIIEPVVVRPMKGRYEVIAGHRRTAAARLAKETVIPCYIRKASDDEVEMLKIHENLYREDVKPSDEARHFDYLIQKQKLTPQQIANLITKSPQYVNDRLAILSWPPFLKEAMEAGEISFSVATQFSRFDDEAAMKNAVRYAKRSGMTSELAKRWVLQAKSEEKHMAGEFTPPSNPPEPAKQQLYDCQCVYCRKGGRLIEMSVVYIHPECLQEANAVALNEESEV